MVRRKTRRVLGIFSSSLIFEEKEIAIRNPPFFFVLLDAMGLDMILSCGLWFLVLKPSFTLKMTSTL